jgi:hypothetical protein
MPHNIALKSSSMLQYQIRSSNICTPYYLLAYVHVEVQDFKIDMGTDVNRCSPAAGVLARQRNGICWQRERMPSEECLVREKCPVR